MHSGHHVPPLLLPPLLQSNRRWWWRALLQKVQVRTVKIQTIYLWWMHQHWPKKTTITPKPKLECCNNFIIYNKELKIHYVFHYYEPSNGFPVYKEKCKERDPLIEHVFPKCKKEELYFHFIGGRWVELRSRRQDRVHLDGKVVREYPKFGPPACPEKTLPLLPNALRGEPVAQCCYTDFCYILSKHA